MYTILWPWHLSLTYCMVKFVAFVGHNNPEFVCCKYSIAELPTNLNVHLSNVSIVLFHFSFVKLHIVHQLKTSNSIIWLLGHYLIQLDKLHLYMPKWLCPKKTSITGKKFDPRKVPTITTLLPTFRLLLYIQFLAVAFEEVLWRRGSLFALSWIHPWEDLAKKH